jgi:hypothetical protein
MPTHLPGRQMRQQITPERLYRRGIVVQMSANALVERRSSGEVYTRLCQGNHLITAPTLPPGQPVSMVPLLPAAEPLSFLKQTHGPWTERDISKVLNISSAEAKQAISAMQLQGYAEPIARTQKWRTTDAGLSVSGPHSACRGRYPVYAAKN